MSKTLRTIALIWIAGIALVSALAGCVREPETALRIGTNVWIGSEPLYLARQHDLFRFAVANDRQRRHGLIPAQARRRGRFDPQRRLRHRRRRPCRQLDESRGDQPGFDAIDRLVESLVAWETPVLIHEHDLIDGLLRVEAVPQAIDDRRECFIESRGQLPRCSELSANPGCEVSGRLRLA